MAYNPRNQYGLPVRPYSNQQPPPQAQKPPPQPYPQNQYVGYTQDGYSEEEQRPYSYKGYDGDGFWEEYGYNEDTQYQHGQHDQYQGQKAPGLVDYPGGQQAQQYPQDQWPQYPPQRRPQGYSNSAGGTPANGQMPPGAPKPPPQSYGPNNREPSNGNHAEQAQQHRGQQQGMPLRQRQARESPLSSTSPTTLSFDNPFPVFPSQKPKSRTDQGFMDQAMGNLDLDRRPSYDSQRPRTAGSRNSKKSSGSGHYNDGYGSVAQRPSPDQAGRPSMDDSTGRGLPKRSMTMPEHTGYPPSNGQPQLMPNLPQNLSYGRAVPGGAYTDPVPLRSSTVAGSRQEPQVMPPQRSFTSVGDIQASQQQPPRAIYELPYGRMDQQGRGSEGQTAMTNGPSPPQQQQSRIRDSQLEAYMPNFDDSNDTAKPLVDPIGLPLDNAPGIQRPPTRGGSSTPGAKAPEVYHGAQAVQRSRSQPDLRGQAANHIYSSGGDAPPMPQVPSPTSAGGFSQQGSPVHLNGAYGHLPTQQPQYARQHSGSYGSNQPQSPTARQFHLPGGLPMPPLARVDTAQSAWSDPEPAAGQRGDSRPPPMRQGQVGQPAVAHGNQQHSYNPDALPAHPAPVRPGLMQDGQSSQVARPPPVRQYGNTQQQHHPKPSMDLARPSVDQQRRLSGPVTYEELSRLRQVVKNNAADNKTRLLLAKKLIEASVVLADENGRADLKTRTKNREAYILEANKIVKKLCASQFPDAMFFLADCYGTGQMGLAVDQKVAFQLYQQAAKLGHPAAAYRTAVCCEMGSDAGGGTRRDPLKAVQWYRRAATLGDVPAMYKLGMIVMKGLLGQQPSLGEAVIWLERAAERADADNPHALHELAIIYETAPNGSKIIRDEAYALQLFNKAARFGYRLSQCRLGKAYEYGQLGCPIDNRSSIHWYSKAAAQEDHEAELALSGWYLTGCAGILDQSDMEAYLWARKAAMAETPKAEFAMGYFSEIGIGCPRSLDDAKRWYGRAAAHHYPKAQERLEELKRGGAKAQRGRERLSRSDRTKQNDDCVLM